MATNNNTVTVLQGTEINIALSTTSEEDVSYSWATESSGVTGATSGTGSSITQTLIGVGTVKYTITPFEVENNCLGKPVEVLVIVTCTKPNVIATPKTIEAVSGEPINILLSTDSPYNVTYSWTVVQTGTTGASNGTGTQINQILNGSGTATYTITPTETLSGCVGTPVIVDITIEGVVAVDENTQINIWFDDSGSMDATRSPLQTMAASILKNCLLPAYDNDSARYDELVQIKNFSSAQGNIFSERYIYLLGTVSENPTVSKTINLTFADESDPYGVGSIGVPFNGSIEPFASEDIAFLRNRMTTTPVDSLFGVSFQVSTGGISNPTYPGFRDFTNRVHNGIAPFTGNEGLSDIEEVSLTLDVNPEGTPTYYANLIITALNSLGFNLTLC